MRPKSVSKHNSQRMVLRRFSKDGAAAICEAVVRPTMRFVAVKTAEHQAAVAAAPWPRAAGSAAHGAGECLAGALGGVRDHCAAGAAPCRQADRHRARRGRREAAGFGAPSTTGADRTDYTEPSGFRSGREFAAWLGLVPRQNSTGGKVRLGGISKRGNRYLRRLLINGASANLLRSKATKADPWVIGLRRRRPSLVVAVALANKTARMAWAVMQRKENYQRMAAAA